MSLAAVRGMVQAYTGARTVSLARCAGQLRHTVDFDNMFRAVSQGARARSQGQSLEKLSLKGCIAIRDDDIASLCHRFDSLRYHTYTNFPGMHKCLCDSDESPSQSSEHNVSMVSTLASGLTTPHGSAVDYLYVCTLQSV